MWLFIVVVASSSLAEDLTTLVGAESRAVSSVVHDKVYSAGRDRGRVYMLMVMELS